MEGEREREKGEEVRKVEEKGGNEGKGGEGEEERRGRWKRKGEGMGGRVVVVVLLLFAWQHINQSSDGHSRISFSTHTLVSARGSPTLLHASGLRMSFLGFSRLVVGMITCLSPFSPTLALVCVCVSSSGSFLPALALCSYFLLSRALFK